MKGLNIFYKKMNILKKSIFDQNLEKKRICVILLLVVEYFAYQMKGIAGLYKKMKFSFRD